ncbi:MAG: right-handed parallel beta-helix repeat-containing protein [Planctomycetota bacterium]
MKTESRTNLNTRLVMSVFLLGFGCTIAAGEVIYVDRTASTGGTGQTWGTAYKYLQDALYKPPTGGDEIWVAAGTYKPDKDEGGNVTPNERSETFELINGVAIYGGFAGNEDPCTFDLADRDLVANETILSGDIGAADVNTDNSYHVVTGSSTDATAILDGFTITAGNADSGSSPNNNGGGMYNNAGSPTVSNCTFSVNSAYYMGGGIYNGSSSPTVSKCTFNGNSAEYGSGICSYNYSSPTVANCTFSGNRAEISGGGIGDHWYCSPTVTNCTFSGNRADTSGGGMWNSNSNAAIVNCTFSNNTTGNYGGAMYIGNGSSTLTNCILWGNTAPSGPQIYNFQSSLTVNYSDVQGGHSGTGNIDADPCFVDADGEDNIVGTEDDNLRLLADSNCIDAGDNMAVPADTADLDDDGDTSERTPLDLAGNARFTDDPAIVDTGNSAAGYPEIVEMGAYERYEFCGSGIYPYPPGDVSGPTGVRDCHVDFYDFAVMAAHWLEYSGPD